MKVHELMNALSTCSAGADVVVTKIMTADEFLALKDCECDGGKDVGGTVIYVRQNGNVYINLD